jgi:hypothetical protein
VAGDDFPRPLKDQLEDSPLGQAFRFVGRPVRMVFPTANADTEVLHQCREIPDGFLVLNSVGVLTAAPLVQWTKDLASLRCTVAAAEALLLFVVLKEDPINVAP